MRRLQAQCDALANELKQYADNDPAAVEGMREGMKAAKEGANRWLDNCYALQVGC